MKAIRLLHATVLDQKGQPVHISVYQQSNGTVTTFVRRGGEPKSAISHSGGERRKKS